MQVLMAGGGAADAGHDHTAITRAGRELYGGGGCRRRRHPGPWQRPNSFRNQAVGGTNGVIVSSTSAAPRSCSTTSGRPARGVSLLTVALVDGCPEQPIEPEGDEKRRHHERGQAVIRSSA